MIDDLDTLDADVVARRLAEVRRRIVSVGGDPGRVRVVAVTKGFGADAVRAACDAGLADVGENYAGELVAKAAALAAAGTAAPRWHFLGGIQRNKVGRLAPHVALWQGVDRVEEGESIARHAPGASVLVEVRGAPSPERGGVDLGAVAPLVDALRGLGLEVRGLMTVAAPGTKAQLTAPGGGAASTPAPPGDPAETFAAVAACAAELGLDEVSMGMSEDLEAAVVAGSTMVRIGRALFGPRPTAARVSQ